MSVFLLLCFVSSCFERESSSPSQFPLMLDMEPYTAAGITAREKGQGSTPQQLYELTGIIVHQGQASAGHYYAFIKHKKLVTDC